MTYRNMNVSDLSTNLSIDLSIILAIKLFYFERKMKNNSYSTFIITRIVLDVKLMFDFDSYIGKHVIVISTNFSIYV